MQGCGRGRRSWFLNEVTPTAASADTRRSVAGQNEMWRQPKSGLSPACGRGEVRGHVTVSVSGSPPVQGEAVSEEPGRALTAPLLPLTHQLASSATL